MCSGLGGDGAQGDEEMRLAGAGVAEQTQRVALSDPIADGQLVDGGGGHCLVGGVVEVLDAFGAGETGGVDPADGAAFGAVVALGHHQLGQEPQAGQLLALRGGDLGEAVTHGGQPQHSTALLGRGRCGGLGDLVPSAHEERPISSWS